jgi:transposase
LTGKVYICEKKMKKYIVTLEESERLTLESIISKRKETSEQVKRAYVLLAADINGGNKTDEAIKKLYGVSIRTIERLRERCVLEGLNVAIHGKPRTVFQEKILDGQVEAHLIALRCSKAPSGYNRWTLDLLADKMVSLNYVEHISNESVRQILKKMNLSLGKSKHG